MVYYLTSIIIILVERETYNSIIEDASSSKVRVRQGKRKTGYYWTVL